MERKRERSRSTPRTAAKRLALELPPERAFVLNLDRRAQPPRRVAGRVEHITSGQVAHVRSLRELLVFLAEVLRQQAEGGRETAYATLVLGNSQGILTAGARPSLDKTAAPAPARPTRRGRKRGAES